MRVARPWRPPSLAEHWRELRARPQSWLVVARNLVPVVGVFALDWSRALVIFSFWFDRLIGLVAILTVMVPVAVRETRDQYDSVAKLAVVAVLAWFVLFSTPRCGGRSAPRPACGRPSAGSPSPSS